MILIGEDGLKRPTMQVQLHDIGGGEGTTRQCRKKELVDDVVSSRSDAGGLARGGMGGHNDAARRARRSHVQPRKIEERALGPAFRMRGLSIGRGEQASLDGFLIQQMIVLATHDVGESRQICHDCPIAKLAIQTYHSVAQWNVLGFHIGADGLKGL